MAWSDAARAAAAEARRRRKAGKEWQTYTAALAKVKRKGAGWEAKSFDYTDRQGYSRSPWRAVRKVATRGMTLEQGREHVKNMPLMGIGWEKIQQMQRGGKR